MRSRRLLLAGWLMRRRDDVPVRVLSQPFCRRPQGSSELGFTDSAKSGAACDGFEPDHAELGGRGEPPPRELGVS